LLLRKTFRERLRRREFPEDWRRILRQDVAYYRGLSPDDRCELEGHIRVFLAEKRFEGCAGLQVTDEIRLVIAAQACVLLLHRDTDYYPGLKTILVYPDAYVAPFRHVGPGGLVTEGTMVRSGESWHRPGAGGPVVLSWSDVRRGAACPSDGHNVALHEFAHQLDGESGGIEGAPVLGAGSSYAAWARVLGAEYQGLIDDLANRRPTVLRPYGAKDPGEFFAVVTEAFFERPRDLLERHPELYAQLREFYKQDPAAVWHACEPDR